MEELNYLVNKFHHLYVGEEVPVIDSEVSSNFTSGIFWKRGDRFLNLV